MDGTSKRPHQGLGKRKTIRCDVKFRGGKWIFTVPGEGTVALADSKQARVLAAMLMNMAMPMEPDDIEDAASLGPVVVRRSQPSGDEPRPGHEADDEALLEVGDGVLPGTADDVRPTAAGDAGDGVNEDERDVDMALERTCMSGSDPDLVMLRGMKQPRHTGDAGDERLVHDLDRRVAALDDGIAAAKARDDGKMAAALGEERAALRKLRDWYLNSMTGNRRPFYSKDVDDKTHRCRMWIVRGLHTLKVNGVPKAADSLDAAISRGMEFIYEGQPGYEWVVAPVERGNLPVLGKPDGGKKSGSEVAA